MLGFWLQVRRLIKVLSSVMQDEEARGLLLITGFFLLTGTLFYTSFEHMTVIDALYFSFATLTTIGYGDLAPATAIGKLFTIMYGLIGLGVMASFIVTIAEHYQTLRQKNRR